MTHVLVVDDEPAICWSLQTLLEDRGHAVSIAPSAEDALRASSRREADVILLDIRLPGLDGLSAMRELRARNSRARIVVMTAFGTLDTAVRAYTDGAFEYLAKPFDLDEAAAVVDRALAAVSRSGREPERTAPEPARPGTLVGAAPAMQKLFKEIALAAQADVPVLITGESGAGKELVARAIHDNSSRREAPFLPVCIAALSPSLVESELFGHVRGSFTGATVDRQGLLELAGSGIVFLDEIGDTPAAVQVKLLRALESREVFAVGDARARSISARLITATNRPLPALIAAGEFREDLYFRLRVFHIHVPPLRERREDIPLLAETFLAHSGRGQRLSPAARDALIQRAWPGNVRELRNTLEYASVVARDELILPEHLPPPTAPGTPAAAADLPAVAVRRWLADRLARPAGADLVPLTEQFLAAFEQPLLEAALDYCRGNLTATARLLGLHRSTLRDKLRRGPDLGPASSPDNQTSD